MKILVIGGTGRIGSKVVERLRVTGHEIVVAASSTGVDVLTSEGLDAAMDGVDVVVDLANSPSFEDAAVLSFFLTAGHNILAAAILAGVRHHVALSVVGTDMLAASGYFRGKIAQERLIRDSGLPYTIIHSTQFFEFLPGIIQSAGDGRPCGCQPPTCSQLPPRMLPKRWHASRSRRQPMACWKLPGRSVARWRIWPGAICN